MEEWLRTFLITIDVILFLLTSGLLVLVAWILSEERGDNEQENN